MEREESKANSSDELQVKKHYDPIISSIGKKKRIKVKRPGSSRQLKIIIFIFAVIIAAIVIAVLLVKPTNQSFFLRTYSSHVVETDTIIDSLELSGTATLKYTQTIVAPETGILDSLLVYEGDWVSRGQVIAVLDAEDLQDSLLSSQKQLIQDERSYERFLLQREQEVLQQSTALDSLEQVSSDAQEYLADFNSLYELGTVSDSELEDAGDAAESALRSLANYKKEIEIGEKLFELNKLDHQDNLIVMNDTISDFQERINSARVVTPISGRVISIVDADEVLGENIHQDSTIMVIADTENPLIETEIEEQYVSSISIGQIVSVSVSGMTVPGEIERIGFLAVTPSGGGTPVVQLEILIDTNEGEVLSGSTAIVEVSIGEIPDAFVLPRGPYLTTGNREYLYIINGNEAIRSDVTFGAVTESVVEVLSGVADGDRVITSSYQNFIDYEKITLGGKK